MEEQLREDATQHKFGLGGAARTMKPLNSKYTKIPIITSLQFSYLYCSRKIKQMEVDYSIWFCMNYCCHVKIVHHLLDIGVVLYKWVAQKVTAKDTLGFLTCLFRHYFTEIL